MSPYFSPCTDLSDGMDIELKLLVLWDKLVAILIQFPGALFKDKIALTLLP